jgi:GTP-binding protein
VAEDKIMAISSITHSNLQLLMHKTAALLADAPLIEPKRDTAEEKVYTLEPGDEIHVEETDEAWVVTGGKVERLAAMSNLQHEDGVIRFARQLRNLGVDAALREAGAENGDQVNIGSLSFVYED